MTRTRKHVLFGVFLLTILCVMYLTDLMPRTLWERSTSSPASLRAWSIKETGGSKVSDDAGQRASLERLVLTPSLKNQDKKSSSEHEDELKTSKNEGHKPSSEHQGQKPSLKIKGHKPSSEHQGQKPSLQSQGQKPSSEHQGQKSSKEHHDHKPSSRGQGHAKPVSPKAQPRPSLKQLGALAMRGPGGWTSLNCNPERKFRQFSVPTVVGNISMYLYDSASEDQTLTSWIQDGWYFEAKEKGQFIRLSRDLPLIDVGANLGMVTLPAAEQGRQVVAVEPVRENALRLCRSVVDFGRADLVHVIQNAVSSHDGNVTLAMDIPAGRVRYEVLRSEGWGYGATGAYSIVLDRLLELLPFKKAALKIDVESHEGHVLAGAERLFQEVDIPMVWLEWEHVKAKKEYGGAYIIQFMERHNMTPHNLMTGRRLSTKNFMKWPFTVLWGKSTRTSSRTAS